MIASIAKYMKLVDNYPQYFKQHKQSRLVLDMGALFRSNKDLGVIYEGSTFQVIVDLVQDQNKNLTEQARIIPADDIKKFLIIAVYQDRFILLKQFIHSIRKYQYMFPTASLESKSDLSNKFGISINSFKYLGKLVADSSISCIETEIYTCLVDSFMVDTFSHESAGAFLISEVDFEKLIAQGKLTDASTLAAYSMWKNKKNNLDTETSNSIDNNKQSNSEIVAKPESKILTSAEKFDAIFT